MKDVYRRLAEFLDTMPQRFPVNTESGVELRVLKKIFLPDEAEMFLNLTLRPETARDIAGRIGEDPAALEKKLYDLSKKGLAFRSGREGGYKYMASAFLVGIIEFQMNRLTPELIQDWEEFEPLLFKSTWLKGTTRDLRTIPIGEAVDPDSQVLPYESIEETIRHAKYVAISDCMCRRIAAIKNNFCSHPMEVCFHFGGGCHYFVENGLARYITNEEAMEIFKRGKESGLVCQVSASQETNAMCMCCACCCGPLKAVKACEKPADMVNSNFFAKVNDDECTGCEMCVELCPMDAISVDDIARVNLDRCIGCGVCAVTCPVEAIKVYRKEKDKEFVPEKNYFDAAMAIYRQRRE
jgi:Na+-translocating ferredoxin:NAD+ oxidoreductase RNF subunit RnfB